MAPAPNVRWAVGLLLWTPAAAALSRTPGKIDEVDEELPQRVTGKVPFEGNGDRWSIARVRKLALHKVVAKVALNVKAATLTASQNNALR